MENVAVKTLDLELAKELLPEKVHLYYVDYNSNLDNEAEIIQKMIKENSSEAIDEKIWEWFDDQEDDSIDSEREELKNKLLKEGYEEEEIDLFLEAEEEALAEIIRSRDDSDVFKDLCRNTSDFVMFYDTGLEVEEGSWNWKSAEINKWLRKIKSKLGIPREIKEYDTDITMMIQQASYGGSLVVYFRKSFEDLFSEDEKDWKTINFSNAAIAIIDIYNGSGDHTKVLKHKFSLPFKRENVFVDEAIKYNYTYAVCGMSSDWCECTKIEFSFEKIKKSKKVESSNMNALIDKDSRYAETYKKGECTTGDMDSNRHRDVVYINEFPCGNKCKKCGTFWID